MLSFDRGFDKACWLTAPRQLWASISKPMLALTVVKDEILDVAEDFSVALLR
jgi:hypothetical protein